MMKPVGAPPLEVKRRDKSWHNAGHFRFFECARIQVGRPEGNLSLREELRFPFDKTQLQATIRRPDAAA